MFERSTLGRHGDAGVELVQIAGRRNCVGVELRRPSRLAGSRSPADQLRPFSEIISGRKQQPPRRSAAHWNSSRSSRRLGLRRPVQPQHESRQVTRGAVGHPNLRGTILKCVVDFVDACHSCHGKPRAPRHPCRGSGGTGTSPRGPTPPSTLRTTRRSRTSGRRHASAAGVCERRLVLAIAR